MVKRAAKETRSTKEVRGRVPTPKQDEVSVAKRRLSEFILTATQQNHSDAINNNTLTFVAGSAGTGKTFTTLHNYCNRYLSDHRLKIIVIRTPAEAGMDKIGFLPDGVNAKLEPHFASTRAILEDLLGKGKVEADLGHRIKFEIPNFMLGATLDNALVLIDEAQMISPIIMKLLLERIGDNSKVVVSGSASQIYDDLKKNERDGMRDAMHKFFNKDDSSKFNDVALVRYTVTDVMRSEIVKTVLRAYGEI